MFKNPALLCVLIYAVACGSDSGNPDSQPLDPGATTPPTTGTPTNPITTPLPSDNNSIPTVATVPTDSVPPTSTTATDPSLPTTDPTEPTNPLPQTPAAGCVAPFAALPEFDCGANGTVMEGHGPSTNRVTYMILGDGYTADLLDTTYLEHIQNMLTGQDQSMFTTLGQPYLRYRNFINICALRVVSNDACIDNDDQGLTCDTALGGRCVPPCDAAGTRLGTADNNLVTSAIEDLAPADLDVDWTSVTINADPDGWWNSGGRIMVWNGAFGNRQNSASVALHEGGHAFHALADEYAASSCGGNERLNVTSDADGAKWQVWIGFDQSIDNPEGTGAIVDRRNTSWVQGAFSIAGSATCFAATPNAQMNLLPSSFSMPSVEKMILDIYDIVDPVDAVIPNNAAPLVNPTELQVQVVDPAIIKVDWRVDGTPVTVNGGQCFDPSTLTAGEHTVTARVYDDTPWVRSDRTSLEQMVEWSVTMR